MTETRSRLRPQSFAAMLVLASLGAGSLLYFAHPVFVPIALAVLFSLLLSQFEALNRQGLPRAVSAIFILCVFLGLLAASAYGLWIPAQKWLASAPRAANVIQQKIAPAARMGQRIEVVSSRAGKLTDSRVNGTVTPNSPVAAGPGAGPAAQGVIVATKTAIVEAMTVVILTLFFLSAATLEGQVVQPLLVGRRLELNFIIVFLTLWFGGWFWGIPGIILAIPCLVALKVAAEHDPKGKPIVEFLSPGGGKRFARGRRSANTAGVRT